MNKTDKTKIRRNTGMDEQIKILTKYSADILYKYDIAANRYTYVSSSVEHLLGYSPEEALSIKPEDMLTSESYRLQMETMKSAIINKKSEPETLEIYAYHKQGHTVPIEVKANFVFDEDRKPVEVVGIARDITERKKAEEKLQETYEKELALRKEMEQELERRIEFTRTLVHELKTPLTPMIAASDLLLEELPEGPLFRVARSIQKGAQTLSKRIDMLLDTAKGEMGILEISRSKTDLLFLINKIAEDMTPLSLARNLHLRTDLPEHLPEVSIDEDRIRQVIVNLLDNSFKFTNEEGVVTIKASLQDRHIIVEVEDNGRGISVEEQKNLFQPYNLYKSKTSAGKGLGLGLALSKSIIELHGGQIQVKSRAGKGSKFSFTLPLNNV